MRRAVILAILALAVPMAARADAAGSQLASFMGVTAPKGHSLGSVGFPIRPLASGSATGSSFIAGKRSYGQPKDTIFSGSLVGPIHWTLGGKVGQELTYTLTDTITGTYDGKTVSGTRPESFYTVPGQLGKEIGHISLGTTQLSIPEPGTLGLLGTGLIGIAGIFRRRLFRTH
jgi:PEP-CTERM motif